MRKIIPEIIKIQPRITAKIFILPKRKLVNLRNILIIVEIK